MLAAFALAAPTAATARDDFSGTALNVLPPGQTGALPPDRHGTDQIRLYDGLTPLFDRVGRGDLTRFFKSAKFDRPRGGRTVRPRKGLRIRRDRFGVPHVLSLIHI